MLETQWPLQTETWLQGVRNTLAEQGDESTAAKVGDLLERVRSPHSQVFVAFCGLFSAGKSSLLNRLTGTGELATGAVPTTAVIAEVNLQDGEKSVVLIDTPGVDSTDETHQAATEGALHRADVIVVVMDYQHVESDANLELARSFSEQGKRLILVVNQVDKHVDWELPFVEFQARIERTLEDWGIAYERLFYTSVDASLYNEVDSLVDWLLALPDSASGDSEQNVRQRVRELVVDHVERRLSTRRHEVEDTLLTTVGLVPFHRDEALSLLHDCQQQADAVSGQIEAELALLRQSQQTTREELVRSVELAQISPYETTERGRLYIESLRPGFKVGWWRAEERTKQEQEVRLAAFVRDLTERADKFLTLPLGNQLRHFVSHMEWAKPEWQQATHQVAAVVSADLCRKTVHQGALVSNQYPYQYVKDVVAAVKRQVYTKLTELLDVWFAEATETKKAQLHDRIVQQRRVLDEIQAIKAWLVFMDERSHQVDSLLNSSAPEVTA